MISGSSQADDIHKRQEINTKEFFRILRFNLHLNDKQIARLDYLIQDGININEQDEKGYTPLYACVIRDNEGLVRKLLDLKADPNIPCNNCISSPTPLHKAIENGSTAVVKLLIAANAKINQKNGHGKTPLSIAAMLGRTDIAKVLLFCRARKNSKDHRGSTPLHEAVTHRHVDIVDILLENKAAIDAIDNEGNTPLHLAVWRDAEIAQRLLNNGADFSIRNRAKETPLCKAFFNDMMYRLMPRSQLALLIKETLVVFINKFIEAGWVRFDILRNVLGEEFADLVTADAMATQIAVQESVRMLEYIKIIDQLYFNAVKMVPPSLVSRLLDAIEYPPSQECAASSSYQDCLDDEQPPAIQVASLRKRSEIVGGRASEEYEKRTKPSRLRRLFF